MIESLADIQQSLAGSLLGLPVEMPLSLRASTAARAESGLAVYRNNVAAGLIKVVSTRFPVARRLVGNESFDAAARAFIAAEPPRSPVLLNYGDTFPQFLRGLGRDACISYVADIADLEIARGKAYHAANVDPLPPEAFAAIPGERLAELRLSFHPSVVLLKSRFPIVSVWQANQGVHDMTLRQWRAEAALVARPRLDVEVWRLPPGGFEFLTELSRRSTMAHSAGYVVDETPEFDLAVNLSLLLDARIVIATW
jgi:hypothetical protein